MCTPKTNKISLRNKIAFVKCTLALVEHVIYIFSYKQYLKSRPGASIESARRIKSLKLETMGLHPLLASAEISQSGGTERDDFLLQMKRFRPSTVSV